MQLKTQPILPYTMQMADNMLAAYQPTEPNYHKGGLPRPLPLNYFQRPDFRSEEQRRQDELEKRKKPTEEEYKQLLEQRQQEQLKQANHSLKFQVSKKQLLRDHLANFMTFKITRNEKNNRNGTVKQLQRANKLRYLKVYAKTHKTYKFGWD